MKSIIIICLFLVGCQTYVEGKYPVDEFLRPNGWNDHFYVA